MNFYIFTIKKDLPQDSGDWQVIIFGHSHKYSEEVRDGRLYLNPGSCGKRRFHQDITMAVLEINNGAWAVERLDIPHEKADVSGANFDIPEGSFWESSDRS